jgi:2-polyprenyl-3-methyl-5-hydroxy-6-metoxy-1,4-benzoquinol methylase
LARSALTASPSNNKILPLIIYHHSFRLSIKKRMARAPASQQAAARIWPLRVPHSGLESAFTPSLGEILSTKIDQVKSLFETPEPYLKRRRFNINIRAETVQYFLRNRDFTRILDVGCGDGSASIPLLNNEKSLTLLDLSENMLSIALSNVPPDLKQNVQPINQDFLSANLEPHSFDLIICLGLLAHVDSPKDVIHRIARLLSPIGVVVVQSTNSGGFLSRAGVSYRRILEAFGRMRYRYALTTADQVVQMLAACGLELSEIYRYSLPSLPGLDRILSQRALYNYVRLAYGPAQNNYNTWPGKECIYLFTKISHP